MLTLWLERGALPSARRDDLSWLGEPERQRLASFGSDRRREEFLAGRDLLRRMLEATGLVGAEPLSFTAEGAPRLVGRPQLHLSLSHRRGWLAAAVADAPVGVDVEVEAPRDVNAMAQRFCTVRERHDLAALPPDSALTHLHTLWALKEAAYKAAFPDQDAGLAARLESRTAPAGSGSARSWRWPDGRVLAVVAAGFDGFEPRGLTGASGPACWHVDPLEPV